jgi:pantoate--beta-alanine ligase
MLVVKTVQELRVLLTKIKAEGQSVGFIPTMGYLHEGHLSLMQQARKNNDVSMASIFVNPTQFNDPKDLELYPRDMNRDISLLEEAGVHILFCPDSREVYPESFQTFVSVEKISSVHEGEFRPGHFKGVATVVNILFNLVAPDQAYFGDKDFQQLAMIKAMVRDLKMPIKVVGCPIVREQDGLAMSSRNVRLSASVRSKASAIYRALVRINDNFNRGETDANALIAQGLKELPETDFKVEYLRIVDSSSLAGKDEVEKGDRIIVAVYLDGVRLIDNLEIEESALG